VIRELEAKLQLRETNKNVEILASRIISTWKVKTNHSEIWLFSSQD